MNSPKPASDTTEATTSAGRMPMTVESVPPRIGATIRALFWIVWSIELEGHPEAHRDAPHELVEEGEPEARRREARRDRDRDHDRLVVDREERGRRQRAEQERRHEHRHPAPGSRDQSPGDVARQRPERLAGADEPDHGIGRVHLVDVEEWQERRREADPRGVDERPELEGRERSLRAEEGDHLREPGRGGSRRGRRDRDLRRG